MLFSTFQSTPKFIILYKVLFSSLGQLLYLTYSTRAFPKPTLNNCTHKDTKNNLSIIDIGLSAEISLTTEVTDVYKFVLEVNVSGEASYGDYECSISNGIGIQSVIMYTIKQDAKFSPLP